jgi:hypothetical protein
MSFFATIEEEKENSHPIYLEANQIENIIDLTITILMIKNG